MRLLKAREDVKAAKLSARHITDDSAPVSIKRNISPKVNIKTKPKIEPKTLQLKYFQPVNTQRSTKLPPSMEAPKPDSEVLKEDFGHQPMVESWQDNGNQPYSTRNASTVMTPTKSIESSPPASPQKQQ